MRAVADVELIADHITFVPRVDSVSVQVKPVAVQQQERSATLRVPSQLRLPHHQVVEAVDQPVGYPKAKAVAVAPVVASASVGLALDQRVIISMARVLRANNAEEEQILEAIVINVHKVIVGYLAVVGRPATRAASLPVAMVFVVKTKIRPLVLRTVGQQEEGPPPVHREKSYVEKIIPVSVQIHTAQIRRMTPS